MGRAPEPYYDPLAFAVAEAHKRGLELHAWINPYRARYSLTRPAAANHVSRTNPELVRKYGPYLWMDPGDPRVRDRTTRVVLDIVRRYDIDALHIDDYFYPYKESQARARDSLPRRCDVRALSPRRRHAVARRLAARERESPRPPAQRRRSTT